LLIYDYPPFGLTPCPVFLNVASDGYWPSYFRIYYYYYYI